MESLELIQPSGSEGRISQPGDIESLYRADEDGDVEKIKEILACQTQELHDGLFSLWKNESMGKLPSHTAARCGNLNALALLLPESSQDFNVQDLANAQTKEGWSAMHLAANSGQLKVVQWLAQFRKANVNLQDQEGFTPLHLAVAQGHKKVVEYLVSQGADLFILDKNNMFPASFCKDSSMFDALLSNYLSRASPSFQLRAREAVSQPPVDGENRTYLHYAAKYGSDADVIARLISEAASAAVPVYVKDKHGDSFLHVAAKSGNMKVLQGIKEFDAACTDKALFLNNGELDPLNTAINAILYDHRNFFDEFVTLSKVEITLSSIIEKLVGELVDKGETQERLALFASTLPTYLALYAKKDCLFDILLETNRISLSQRDDE